MKIEVSSAMAMQQLGARIGALCRGGEVIELVGDIGAGKTTFTKGLARGMGIGEDVQSPTFTINRTYDASEERVLAHYDFYRLSDPGILRSELAESVTDPRTVTVVEWAEIVEDVLPADTLRIMIVPDGEMTRAVSCEAGGHSSRQLLEALK